MKKTWQTAAYKCTVQQFQAINLFKNSLFLSLHDAFYQREVILTDKAAAPAHRSFLAFTFLLVSRSEIFIYRPYFTGDETEAQWS